MGRHHPDPPSVDPRAYEAGRGPQSRDSRVLGSWGLHV